VQWRANKNERGFGSIVTKIKIEGYPSESASI